METEHEQDEEDGVKRMDIAEFRDLGFLQEANRLFFHPHGLALEVIREEDGTERLGGVWDYRDDPEGIVFSDGVDRDKWQAVANEYERHREARLRLMSGAIQPIDWPGCTKV